MKRFRRWLLYMIAAMSLLLCMASLALWARSYWYVDELTIDRPGSRMYYYFVSYPSELFLQFARCDKPNDPAGPGVTLYTDGLGPAGFPVGVSEIVGPSCPTIMGFDWYWDQWPESNVRPLTMKVPFWAVSLLLAISPAAAGWKAKRAIARSRAARRIAAGCCIQCGYDLRATPDRCPECGTVPKKP
jgi:hypothetical protein